MSFRLSRRAFIRLATVASQTLWGSIRPLVARASQPAHIPAHLPAHLNEAADTITGISPPLEQPDNIDLFPPSEPEDFTATAMPGYILLDWYASNDDSDVIAYEIQRNGVRLAWVNSGVNSYADATVLAGVTYRYEIVAIDTVGHRSTTAHATATGVETAKSQIFLPVVEQPTSPLPADVARPQLALAVNAKLRRYPYLTDMVGPYVTINWATDTTVTTGSVTYGEYGVESVSAHTVVATRTAITVNSVSQYQWKAMLQLKPNTQYHYRVFGGSTDLLGSDNAPQFWTQLAAGANAPFSFVVIGDWGDVDNASTQQASLMSLIAQTGARFGFTTGDNAYPSGSQTNYGDLVQTGTSMSGIFGPQYWALPGRSMALFPAIGNHGYSSSSAAHPHLTNWPQQMVAQLCGGRYQIDNYSGIDGTTAANYPSTWYAFSVGNARFYVLEAAWADSNTGNATGGPYQVDYDYHWAPGRPQYQWLANDLANNPYPHKFVFFHYPLYSDNKSEKSDTYLQGVNSIEGLLASYGVQFIFNGHAHLYQRNQVGNLNVYVVGATGVKLQYMDKGCSAVDQYALGWSNSKSKGYACGAASVPSSKEQVYSYLLVTVNGNSVTVSPKNANGQVFDQQTFNVAINDTSPPSVPANLSANAVSNNQVNLSWSAATDNVALAGYDIYRNGSLINSIGTELNYADTALLPNTTYTYQVAARDTSANISALSSAAIVTTPGTGIASPTPTPTPTATATATATLAPTATPSPTPIDPNTPTPSTTATATQTPTATQTAESTQSPTPTATQSPTATQTAESTQSPTPTATQTAASTQSPTPTATPTPTIPASTLIFQDGFESGTLSAWTSSSGLVVQSAEVFAGTKAAQGNTTNGATYAKKTLPATYADGYGRVYFKLLSYSNQVNLLRLRTAADGSLAYVYVTTDGLLALRNDVAATNTISSVAVSSGVWHALELHCTINGLLSTTEVWLDNVRINALSITTNLGSTAIGRLQIGEVQSGRTYNVILDQAAFGLNRIGL